MSLKTENLTPGTVQPNPAREDHPPIELLSEYHHGRLTEADEDRIQEHFIFCADCRETMLELVDFLDGVSRPSRWRPADLVREWQRVREALKRENTPSGRTPEPLPSRHG